MDARERLTIGKLSKITGIGIEAIRFYEKEGLIPEPPRAPSGYRQYSQDSISRINFILKAKNLGFTLTEIKELLSLRIHSRSNCSRVKARTEQKIIEIQEKIDSLAGIKKALTRLAKACDQKDNLGNCPILAALEE